MYALQLKPQPFSHKLVIDFIDVLLLGDKLLLQEGLCCFLYAAGRREVMAFYELHTSDLACLAFLANGHKQVTLSGCQLEECIFVGFLILTDDLCYRSFNIICGGMVCRGIELVQDLL